MRKSTYDKHPTIDVAGFDNACIAGWDKIADRINSSGGRPDNRRVIAVEAYPGVLDDEILPALRDRLKPSLVIRTSDALWPQDKIEAVTAHDYWAEDAVLGRLTAKTLIELFDPEAIQRFKREIVSHDSGVVLIYGIGAALFAQPDVLIYADLARWEIQRRQRANLVHGIGVDDFKRSAWEQYKRGFFIDWRLADKHKHAIWNGIDLFLDTNTPGKPKLVQADAVRAGLQQCVDRPFRVVPFFDPGVWGGQWMKEVCDLDRSAVNYAWCFDCVPEENSLLLGFGEHRIELPSLNLVFQHPRELLGDAVYHRFGAEFPIRFDFLDTMGGGNLSLQVHPLVNYIQQTFGMSYTQDESYYMLDAGDDACVYLGFQPKVDPNTFIAALETAQENANEPLDADRFVNKLPARKHDHFLIPAGTIHCSGKNSMVLEISATPYIFTHKLWDWGRLDLNGKPRPISIGHGKKNLDYSRDTNWVNANLVNRIEKIAQRNGWHEERTGLHESEFIETRRHWFTVPVEHDTRGTVNVINLVEGEEVTVESPTGTFAPFIVHYAETFIVPAAVGQYTISPSGPSIHQKCATMKAFVRSK